MDTLTATWGTHRGNRLRRAAATHTVRSRPLDGWEGLLYGACGASPSEVGLKEVFGLCCVCVCVVVAVFWDGLSMSLCVLFVLGY